MTRMIVVDCWGKNPRLLSTRDDASAGNFANWTRYRLQRGQKVVHAASMHFIRISQNWRNRKRDSRYIMAGPICRSYSTRSIPLLHCSANIFFPRSVVNFSLQIYVYSATHTLRFRDKFIERGAAIKLSSD